MMKNIVQMASFALIVAAFAACVGEEPATEEQTSATVPAEEDDVGEAAEALTVGHCWACGNTLSCYNSHTINVCLARCVGDPNYYEVSAFNNQWGKCTNGAIGFCAGRGGYIDACWGRNW